MIEKNFIFWREMSGCRKVKRLAKMGRSDYYAMRCVNGQVEVEFPDNDGL